MALHKSLGPEKVPHTRTVNLDGPLRDRAVLKLLGNSPREIAFRFNFNRMMRSPASGKHQVYTLRNASKASLSYDDSSSLGLTRSQVEVYSAGLESTRQACYQALGKALKGYAVLVGANFPVSLTEQKAMVGYSVDYTETDFDLDVSSLTSPPSLKLIQQQEEAKILIERARSRARETEDILSVFRDIVKHGEVRVQKTKDQLRGFMAGLPSGLDGAARLKLESDKAVGLGLVPEGDDLITVGEVRHPAAFLMPVVRPAVVGLRIETSASQRLPCFQQDNKTLSWEGEYLLQAYSDSRVNPTQEALMWAPKESISPSGQVLPLPLQYTTELEAFFTNRKIRFEKGTKGKPVAALPYNAEAVAWYWLIVSWNDFHSGKFVGSRKDARVPLSKKLESWVKWSEHDHRKRESSRGKKDPKLESALASDRQRIAALEAQLKAVLERTAPQQASKGPEPAKKDVRPASSSSSVSGSEKKLDPRLRESNGFYWIPCKQGLEGQAVIDVLDKDYNSLFVAKICRTCNLPAPLDVSDKKQGLCNCEVRMCRGCASWVGCDCSEDRCDCLYREPEAGCEQCDIGIYHTDPRTGQDKGLKEGYHAPYLCPVAICDDEYCPGPPGHVRSSCPRPPSSVASVPPSTSGSVVEEVPVRPEAGPSSHKETDQPSVYTAPPQIVGPLESGTLFPVFLDNTRDILEDLQPGEVLVIGRDSAHGFYYASRPNRVAFSPILESRDGGAVSGSQKGKGKEVVREESGLTPPAKSPPSPERKKEAGNVTCRDCGKSFHPAQFLQHAPVCRKGKGKAPSSSKGKGKEKENTPPPVPNATRPGRKEAKPDPLTIVDPLNTGSTKGLGVKDLAPEYREVLTQFFKLDRTPIPSSVWKAMPKKEAAALQKSRSIPKWAVKLVLRDPTLIADIVRGDITKSNAIEFVSRQGKREPSRGSKPRVQEAVLAWTTLKSKFSGVPLLSRPNSAKEKAFRKGYDSLLKEFGELNCFPTPKSGVGSRSQSRGRSRGSDSPRRSSNDDRDRSTSRRGYADPRESSYARFLAFEQWEREYRRPRPLSPPPGYR